MSDNAQNAQNAAAPIFDIVRVYTKDCSMETPNVPAIFAEEWKPDLKLDFECKTDKLQEENFEVDLRVTVTCKCGEKVAFICEVHQAGIFKIANAPDGLEDFLLNGVAPNILYPYARELISSSVVRSTFPPLNLRPLNFEAMYHQQRAQAAAQARSDVANGAAADGAPQA